MLALWFIPIGFAYCIVLSLYVLGYHELLHRKEVAKNKELLEKELLEQKRLEDESDIIEIDDFKVENLIENVERTQTHISDIGRKLIISKELLKSHKEKELNLKKQ